VTAHTRVALDIHALQVEGFADRGIGRYVAGYSAALARTGRVAGALLAPELPPPSGIPPELIEMDLLKWDCRMVARQLTAGPVAYHVTAPFLHSGPYDPPALGVVPHWAEADAPRAVILYDLIPLRAPRHYLPTPAHEARYRQRADWVSASDLVLSISEHTRQDAVDLLGLPADTVVTVGAGVSKFFSPPDGTDEELWRFHFPALDGRPFLLTIGGSDWRKATDRAITALGVLVRRGWDLHLLVVGALTHEWVRRLLEVAVSSRVADRVVFTGAIDDELLRACYRRAVATIMPSLAEGAGLPVLESAACGTPALASVKTALAETAATPLALFDPSDGDAVAECVAGLLADEDRRSQILRAQQDLAARSTWDAVAERAGRALDGLFDSGVSGPVASPSSRSLTRRVALAGPLPPHGGGIGTYNSRLLGAVPAGGPVRFDAVWSSPDRPDIPGHVGYVCSDAMGIDVRPASYDQIVYVLGNSGGHLPTVGLALRYPGWVWLHEARLPAVATSALENLSDAEFETSMTRLLSRAYPGRSPLAAWRRAGRSNLDLVAAGVGLIGPLAERCTGILVNSEVARRMVLLDLAPLAAHPPVRVLPPACPPVRDRLWSQVDFASPLVVALGVVSMSKRPDLLVDAAARGRFRLAFVGPCPSFLRQYIEERATVLSVSDRVIVAGGVEAGDWESWLDRASLAVQLRGSLTGETSAAVLEALAWGVPVMTNVASAFEYPVGTVAAAGDIDPGSLAARIRDLLDSPDELRRQSAAGQAFAEDHQFDHLLGELLRVTLA
jgi:glycosyltransferase involved in cell wall biosynthesis